MSARALYRLIRLRLHRRVVRNERKRHRKFLQMPFKPTSTAWPTVHDERNSVGRFRRESGR